VIAASCSRARRVVEALIFDAGGVLLYPDLDWLAARAGEQGHPCSREALRLAYHLTIREVDLREAGYPDSLGSPAFTSLEMRRWFLSRMLGHAGVAADEAREAGHALAVQALARFPRESDIYHFAVPGLRGELVRLRAAGLRLAVASNNDGALAAQLANVQLLDLFEPGALMDSGIEGTAKPDPELVLRAARALGLPPARCLFVGDVDRVDGAAARAAGTAFALYDPLLQPRPARPHTIARLGELLEAIVAPT
jgi:HAD superfamily hydrolase (TIGR01509 family)